MRQLTSIVAVNQDGVIGCRNSLPWRVKSDLAFFKSSTLNNVVIMGRKTYDSLGRCLPARYNVVLSNQFGLFDDAPNCVLREGIIEGIAEAEAAPQKFESIFVIGGATMYAQFHEFVDRYLVTVIDKEVKNGDAFFDMSIFRQSTEWNVSRVLPKTQGKDDEASFEIFELLAVKTSERGLLREEAVAALRAKRLKTGNGRRRSRAGVGSDGEQLLIGL